MKWLSTFTIHRLLGSFIDSLIALLFDIRFHPSISISLFLTLSHAFKNRNEPQHQLRKTFATAIIPTRCDKLVYWSSQKIFSFTTNYLWAHSIHNYDCPSARNSTIEKQGKPFHFTYPNYRHTMLTTSTAPILFPSEIGPPHSFSLFASHLCGTAIAQTGNVLTIKQV